ncbi:MAG: hypothetical protein AABW54_04550 [Candidatus Micrarchaeota archaeon]
MPELKNIPQGSASPAGEWVMMMKRPSNNFNNSQGSRDSRPRESGSRDSRPGKPFNNFNRGSQDRRFEHSRGERPPFQQRGNSNYRNGPNSRGDADGREKFFSKAREKLREAFTGKGASLVQSIRTLDDLDNTKSLLFERLKEWFANNFPELSLESEETYCRLVATFGCKEELEYSQLEEIVGSQKAQELMQAAEKSAGAPFTIGEKNAAASLAKAILTLFEERKAQETFINSEAQIILPNVTALAEPLVAARLLSLAGSLHKLGEMPSSTIQVIGAEKSLFKHLRSHGRTPSPKHGAIFQNTLVRGAVKEKRGRIARTLAAKIAIAGRADAFSGNFIAPLLKKQLQKQLARVK